MTVPSEEIAALLAVPPEEFVATRTARVKELKAEGDKDLAGALGTVRKPLRLVWIVGELARRHPDVAASAADVAAELEEAQGGGGSVRPLLKRFRDVVTQVVELADDLDGTVDRLEVGLALREVLADADARAAWLGGYLLALPGDDEDDAVTVAPSATTTPAKRAPRRATGTTAAKGTSAADAEEAAARAAEEARQAHAAAVAAATATVEEADGAVADAEATRDEAAEEVSALEEQLEELQVKVAAARAGLTDAQSSLDDATAAADEARQTLADVEASDPDGPPGPRRRRRRR